MHLVSIEMGENIVSADREAGVGLKPSEDALAVVRMVASPETCHCALRQRMHMLQWPSSCSTRYQLS